MRRKAGLILIIFLFFGIILSYGEEVSLYPEVYYDDKAGENHFSDVLEAIAHLEEGGTLYWGKVLTLPTFTYKTIPIYKSMKIQSLQPQTKMIKINSTNVTVVFDLKNISWFELEGLYVTGSQANIVSGKAGQVNIHDSKFESCNPINLQEAGEYKVSLNSNVVIDGGMKITPVSGSAEVSMYDNSFQKLAVANTIYLKNVNLKVYNNLFDQYVFIIEDGQRSSGFIENNQFLGLQDRLMIYEEGGELHFRENTIIKSRDQAIYYNGTEELDFTQNWWGSKEGPSFNIIRGNVNTSNWALFEDFSRFKNDPYTRKDLENATAKLGSMALANDWIYDITKDGWINLLDCIGIIRLIEGE